MMQLIINGKNREIRGAQNLTELLAELQLAADRIVVELNREILTADQFSSTTIKAGDRLELIQFVGGG